MKVKKYVVRLGLLGLASAIALPAIAIPAMAQTYSGNNVYQVMRSNGTPQVIVANRTPGERLTITYPDAVTSRRSTANACGLVVLRDSTSNPLTNLVSVDGMPIDQATLPTQLLPRCVNGSLEEARTANFKTGAGEVVIVKTPNTVYEVAYNGGRDRSVSANACGFAAINESSTYPWASNPTIVIDGTTYTLATLPTANLDPLCRSGHLYTPASW